MIQLSQLQDQLSTKGEENKNLKYKLQSLKEKEEDLYQEIDKLKLANKAHYNLI